MTLQRSAGARPLKILVAEDNTINQRLVIGMLTTLGHTGVVVGDGEKALKCLAKLQFDAVLMDVMMPLMDGLEALAAIRAQEQQTGRHCRSSWQQPTPNPATRPGFGRREPMGMLRNP